MKRMMLITRITRMMMIRSRIGCGYFCLYITRRGMRMEGWKHFVWFHFCLSTCCESLQCNSTFHFTSFTIFSRRSVHFTHVSTRPCLFCLDLSVWTLVDCLCAGLFFHCVSFFPCMFFSLFFSPCLCGFSHLLSLMRKGAASMPTLPSTDFCLVKGGPILNSVFFFPTFPLLSDFLWKLVHCQFSV